MKALIPACLLILAGCAVTPDELRQQEPHLTAALPDNYAEAARCVGRKFENKKSAMFTATPVEIRDYPREEISELVSRHGVVLGFITEFRPATVGSTMRVYYVPPVFGGETALEHFHLTWTHIRRA